MDCLCDLHRELSCRDENECAYVLLVSAAIWIDGHLLNEWQRERGGLAGSGGRLA